MQALQSDVSSIIEVRQYFDEPIKELRKHLDEVGIDSNHPELYIIIPTKSNNVWRSLVDEIK